MLHHNGNYVNQVKWHQFYKKRKKLNKITSKKYRKKSRNNKKEYWKLKPSANSVTKLMKNEKGKSVNVYYDGNTSSNDTLYNFLFPLTS